jgi:hypothetical protein
VTDRETSTQKKHEKIERKNVLATCPDVILVLYDAYTYGYADTTITATARVAFVTKEGAIVVSKRP